MQNTKSLTKNAIHHQPVDMSEHYPPDEPAQATLKRDEVIDGVARTILRQVFSYSSEPALKAIEKVVQYELLPAGLALDLGPDASRVIYIVIIGRLSIEELDARGDRRTIDELSCGDAIVVDPGDLTSHTSTPRIHALRDCIFVRIHRSDYECLQHQYPEVGSALIEALNRRVARSTTPTPHSAPSSTTTIAVISDLRRTELMEFLQSLTMTLAPHDGCLLLTSELVEQTMGCPGITKGSSDHDRAGALVAWLSHREEHHRYVVYVTDPVPNRWSRRCLRQADHTVIVANANCAPHPGPVEQALVINAPDTTRPRGQGQRHLILLHPPQSQRPSNTRAWLDRRAPLMHHHVRRHNRSDMERVGRFLKGNAVGLVLGGGGALGYAHIGVLRALTTLGVPIDIIGGTSAGSVVGGSYLLGWSFDDILRHLISGWSAIFSPRRFAFSFRSILSAKKSDRLLRAIVKDTQIEDLWIKFYCVATSLTTADAYVFRRGPLATGVAASGRVPGLLPPIEYDGNYLIDGGVLDNVPVDTMRELCGPFGTVIVVNVFSPAGLGPAKPLHSSRSLLQQAWGRIKPKFTDILSLNVITVMRRAAELNVEYSLRNTLERNAVDLFLDIPVRGHSVANFSEKSARALERIGFEYAHAKIEQWRHTQTDSVPELPTPTLIPTLRPQASSINRSDPPATS